MELIRRILFAIEDCDDGAVPREFEIEGYSQDQIRYHCYQIYLGGLVDAVPQARLQHKVPNLQITHLTPAGHDFIDHARDDTLWRRVRAKLGDASIDVTLAGLKAAAIQAVKSQFGG
ncbi:DUF2513 domain-containing protein [Rhodopirellula halodulae]|uniref:DUF2513 domain-containing protein n=1 Tax=Rhodopirellula halodulae TaxID=2894198 RepID=UPI001E4733EB|nr:DUF2513 domain-containing protein [Rhodopirellula sp. JC737]MCC9655599.1 DUF2513 domain-containing protein [Rhodopirellula sp. JC737]